MSQYNDYIADGSTRLFLFRFAVFDRSDLQVSIDGIPQTAGWSPFGLGSGNGGSVEFATAPATGTVIRITRIEIPPQVPFLLRDENLADIQDKPQARTSLGVYSTTQTDTAIAAAVDPVAAGALHKAANLSDVTDVAQARTNLGVYSTTQTDTAIAAAVDPVAAGALQKSANLSDVADVAQARTNLGVYSTSQTDTAIAAAVDPVAAGALQKAANLSDVTDVAQARTNLGVAIGSDVQAHDADLDWLSANLTAAGKALLDDSDAAAQRATLEAAAANHTHASSSISDFSGAVQSIVSSMSGVGTLEYVETRTVTGGVIDVTGIVAGYDYIFEMEGISCSSPHLFVRFGTGAGPTWDTATNYDWLGTSMETDGSTNYGPYVQSHGSYSFIHVIQTGSSSNDGACGMLTLQNPGGSSRSTNFRSECFGHGTYFHSRWLQGRYRPTTAITGVRFYSDEGNLSGGEVLVYRRKRSA